MKKITLIFTAVVVVLAISYDFYAVFVGGTEASISHLVITSSKEFPLITLSLGILMGHFYFPMRITKTVLEQMPSAKRKEIQSWLSELDKN